MVRNCGLDFLKFICAFLVVCIHALFPDGLGDAVLPITRIAVPIFFMITGYYYSHTKERKKDGKQLIKILKLFLGANLFYFSYWVIEYAVLGRSISSFVARFFTHENLVKLICFNISPLAGHLWYLGAIVYVLLIIFLFEKIADRKFLYPLVPILLIADVSLGKYSLLLFGKVFDYFYLRNFLFVGIPYFLLGDILYRKKDKINIKRNTSQWLVVLFVGTSWLERYLLEIFDLNRTRDHYISTTFLAIFVFLTALHYKQSENKCFKGMCYIGANLSTNIYVIHPMFVWVSKAIMADISEYAFFYTAFSYLRPILIFGAATLVTYILHIVLKRIKSAKVSKKTDG